MKLADLDSLDAHKLARALAAAGIVFMNEEEEVLLRRDSAILRAFRMLAGMMLAPMPLSDEDFERVVGLASAAFCIGATYATMPEVRN